MKYYIAVNNQPQGPFEINELSQKGITPDTLLWCEGMSNWLPAKDIAEVNSELFNSAVPPVYNAQKFNSQQQVPPTPPTAQATPSMMPKPKTWLVESILCTVFCCQIFGIIAIIMSALAESAWSRKDYAETEAKAKQARTWVLVSFIIGILQVIGWILYVFLIIGIEAMATI